MKLISFWIYFIGTVYSRIRPEDLHDGSISKGSKFHLVKTKKGHGRVHNKLPVTIDEEKRRNVAKYLGS